MKLSEILKEINVLSAAASGDGLTPETAVKTLSEGYALYLPENDRPASRYLLYCMADFTRNKLLVSGEPFPIRTYRVKDGIRHPAGQREETSEKRAGRKPFGRKL